MKNYLIEATLKFGEKIIAAIDKFAKVFIPFVVGVIAGYAWCWSVLSK